MRLAGGMVKQRVDAKDNVHGRHKYLRIWASSAKWTISAFNASSEACPRQDAFLYLSCPILRLRSGGTLLSFYHADSGHGGDRMERLRMLVGSSCPLDYIHIQYFTIALHTWQRFNGVPHVQRLQIKECGGAH